MSLPQQLTMEGGACQITGNSHTIAFHALRPWPSVSAGPPVSASRLGAKDSNVPQLLHNKEEKFMALWHQDFELCRSRSLAMDTVRHNKRSLVNGFAVGRPAIHACVHLKSMSIRCLGTLFLTAAKPQQCRNRKCYTMANGHGTGIAAALPNSSQAESTTLKYTARLNRTTNFQGSSSREVIETRPPTHAPSAGHSSRCRLGEITPCSVNNTGRPTGLGVYPEPQTRKTPILRPC